ncbi:hypothetical protein MNBD_CPR01-584 [hydrothermal vent metagenome]|uniref:Helix-turn-helix domain-containing protein n=1 Tax=hydrothermal vent metagenome TaxID=652676 RepID=A0A3B0UNM6_9ZZZZ
MNKTPLKLSAREASNKTGYTTSYIASRCRLGEIKSERGKNNKLIIYSDSLEEFMRTQTLRKEEHAKEVARLRCKEYKQAQKRVQKQVQKKHTNQTHVFIPKIKRDISVKIEKVPRISLQSSIASVVALTLAFVCMFSAYTALAQLVSGEHTLALASVAAAPSTDFEMDGNTNSEMFTDTSPAYSGVGYVYVHTGVVLYGGIRKVLDTYKSFVLKSSDTALSVGVVTRDVGKKVAIFTGMLMRQSAYVPIRAYTRGIYAFVNISPHITKATGRAILSLGDSIMSATNMSTVATVVLYRHAGMTADGTTSVMSIPFKDTFMKWVVSQVHYNLDTSKINTLHK